MCLHSLVIAAYSERLNEARQLMEECSLHSTVLQLGAMRLQEKLLCSRAPIFVESFLRFRGSPKPRYALWWFAAPLWWRGQQHRYCPWEKLSQTKPSVLSELLPELLPELWQSAGDQFTVFAILYCFRYLEAFGSIWILTIIIGTIWKFYWFRLFVFSVSKRCKIAKTVSIQMLPNASK